MIYGTAISIWLIMLIAYIVVALVIRAFIR